MHGATKEYVATLIASDSASNFGRTDAATLVLRSIASYGAETFKRTDAAKQLD
jgi:hypothetical protein